MEMSVIKWHPQMAGAMFKMAPNHITGHKIVEVCMNRDCAYTDWDKYLQPMQAYPASRSQVKKNR